MKIYRMIIAPVIPLMAIFIIYPITGSIIFSIIWSLAIIFGIYDLERFFTNRNIYFVTVAIVFGVFFGSAIFVIDHSFKDLHYTVNVFIPVVTYIDHFNSLFRQ